MIGFIQIPRSIEEQAWYKRPQDRMVALHLLLKVTYRRTEHPEFGILEAGSYLTTYRQLADELGMKNSTCEGIIARLKAEGFLEIKRLKKLTQVVITWQDFTTLRDNIEDNDIMLSRTNSRTNSRTLKNNIENNSYNNTHTEYSNNLGINQNAPAREAHTHDTHTDEQVAALIEWMERERPVVKEGLLRFEQPLSLEDLRNVCATHTQEQIRDMLEQMVSKGYYEKHRFASRVLRDFINAEGRRRTATEPAERYYTYDEVCDMVAKGIPQDNYEFVSRDQWRRKRVV